MFKKYILPTLVWWVFRSLMASWRVKVHMCDEFKAAVDQGSPLILAHWHGDELALLPTAFELRLCTMTSTSSDGHLMDHVLRKLGLKTSRGSSTRGAVSALKGLVRLIKKEHRHATMAVDGPKGPIYQPKPGVFEIARLTKGQVAPFAARCLNAKVFDGAWNKAYLPLPFAKVTIVFGKPWPVLGKNDDPKSPEIALRLRADIDAARQQAMELITAI